MPEDRASPSRGRAATYEARVQAAKAQAVREFRAQSVKTMNSNIAATSVRNGLGWAGRKRIKADKAKTWALNVHKRA